MLNKWYPLLLIITRHIVTKKYLKAIPAVYRDTDIRSMSCDYEGKDQSDASTRQGTPRIATINQKLEKAKKDYSPECLKGT